MSEIPGMKELENLLDKVENHARLIDNISNLPEVTDIHKAILNAQSIQITASNAILATLANCLNRLYRIESNQKSPD